MSYTTAQGVDIELVGEKEIAKELGDLRGRALEVMRQAVNRTASDARRRMIWQAKAQFAVTAKGKKHLDELKLRKKATRSSPCAELHIGGEGSFGGRPADRAYFQHKPTKERPGGQALTGPEYFQGKVLKKDPMAPLTGTSSRSKGFLAKFASGHVGMVQRVLGSSADNVMTRRGKLRWRNKEGKVEKLVTMNALSGAKMHELIWPTVREDVQDKLEDELNRAMKKTLAKAGK